MLHFIQARDPDLVNKPFFAEFNVNATWISDLKPALAEHFPWESRPVSSRDVTDA